MTVPRVAYFYWSGGPLPWICAQSVATFRRHHPVWRVVLGSPELEVAPEGVELERDEVTDPSLPAHKRSDVWRWWTLQRGGWYSDTDVVYLRSVDSLLVGDHDAWVTTDGGHVLPNAKRGWRWDARHRTKKLVQDGLSIGAMAAKEGSELARRCAESASAARICPVYDYQSHGTSMLVPQWAKLTAGLSIGPLPFSALYSGSTDSDVAEIWREGSRPDPRAVGIHWYYGSPESRPFHSARGVEDLPDCAVRSAILS